MPISPLAEESTATSASGSWPIGEVKPRGMGEFPITASYSLLVRGGLQPSQNAALLAQRQRHAPDVHHAATRNFQRAQCQQSPALLEMNLAELERMKFLRG